jgi:two-component system cell cycle sensor histidine kinase/response regulator CckA
VPYHSLLTRQLKRHVGDSAALPPEWRAFVDAVNQAYRQSDADRLLIERSLDLSSEELGAANAQMRKAVFALQQAQADLESRVKERTRELTQANESLHHANLEQRRLEEELRQAHKMEAIGQLAGGIAHDFNNLLIVIFGQVDMLLEDKVPETPAAALREIQSAAESAATLTRQLLAFSRRQTLAPTVLDLNTLVANTSGLVRRLVGEGVDVQTDLDAAADAVSADPGQLQQVLLNLAANARDAMRDGGRLTIATQRVDIAPGSERDGATAGSWAVLSVTDSGVGMPPDVRSRIFEPFFTTKGQGHGTGLGLSTAYGIVKQSGGHIGVTSEPGQGAQFRVWLPSVAGALTEVDAPAAVRRQARGVVLVAEDQEPVRRAIRRWLERAGYDVLDAEDGVAALERAAEADSIDVLLTDLVMPRMGGRVLAERLAELRPDLKVLYMTGYVDDAEVTREVRDGTRLLLQKPFKAETLLSALDTLLQAAADRTTQ